MLPPTLAFAKKKNNLSLPPYAKYSLSIAIANDKDIDTRAPGLHHLSGFQKIHKMCCKYFYHCATVFGGPYYNIIRIYNTLTNHDFQDACANITG